MQDAGLHDLAHEPSARAVAGHRRGLPAARGRRRIALEPGQGAGDRRAPGHAGRRVRRRAQSDWQQDPFASVACPRAGTDAGGRRAGAGLRDLLVDAVQGPASDATTTCAPGNQRRTKREEGATVDGGQSATRSMSIEQVDDSTTSSSNACAATTPKRRGRRAVQCRRRAAPALAVTPRPPPGRVGRLRGASRCRGARGSRQAHPHILRKAEGQVSGTVDTALLQERPSTRWPKPSTGCSPIPMRHSPVATTPPCWRAWRSCVRRSMRSSMR